VCTTDRTINGFFKKYYWPGLTSTCRVCDRWERFPRIVVCKDAL